MLVIVDYGVGNLASIRNMLKKIGVEGVISSRVEDILKADKLILPGVGAFDTCAQKLQESGLLEKKKKKVIRDNCSLKEVKKESFLGSDGSKGKL